MKTRCFTSDSQTSNTDMNACNELNKIIEEAKALDVTEMKALELVLSRANDNNGHKYQYILDNYRIFIYPRRGCAPYQLPKGKDLQVLKNAPYFDISSTEIRQQDKKK